ncbi:unnamed protein product [Onchocerca ochengi]|uniref:Secreted protein n=1 Tax=Onchocerca ochengi TaxID=42157 RepID=A0A182DXY5_ONCOC|nr:unnamed protein product [Onchocerca ochengi]
MFFFLIIFFIYAYLWFCFDDFFSYTGFKTYNMNLFSPGIPAFPCIPPASGFPGEPISPDCPSEPPLSPTGH